MPLVTKRFLICDRCGVDEPVDEGLAPIEITQKYPGWSRVSGDRVLCPDCTAGYELLEARHKVEVEDYITKQ